MTHAAEGNYSEISLVPPTPDLSPGERENCIPRWDSIVRFGGWSVLSAATAREAPEFSRRVATISLSPGGEGWGEGGRLFPQASLQLTNRAATNLFDVELELLGSLAVFTWFAEPRVIVIHFEPVGDDVLVRRDRHERFPAVAGLERRPHLVSVETDDDVRLDAVGLDRLLGGVPLILDEVKIVRVPRLGSGGEVGDRRDAAQEQQRQGSKRQQFLCHSARELHTADGVVKLHLGKRDYPPICFR